MTIKEAINILSDIGAINSYRAEDAEAFDMAIKALEQKADLDKIKAEIERKCCITVGRDDEPAMTLYDIFHIIDKYKKSPTGAEWSEQ